MHDEQLIRTIRGVLQELRPNIQMGGGDIHFLGYNDCVVSVGLSGICCSCVSMRETVLATVQEHLRDVVPEVRDVVFVSEH